VGGRVRWMAPSATAWFQGAGGVLDSKLKLMSQTKDSMSICGAGH